MRISVIRHRYLKTLGLGCLLLGMTLLIGAHAAAAVLTNRSITIPTAITNATTSHQYHFNYVSANSVGSVVFEYCDNSPIMTEPCNAPAGLNVANVILGSQSGQTGFIINTGNTTASRIVISRPPLSVVPGAAGYTFNNAVNASTPNKTIFVRISSHATTDGSGTAIDQGAVAFILTSSLAVSAFIPPYLALCAGVNIAGNCSSTTGQGISLGMLSSAQANVGTTQVAAATNDVSGYTLSVLGSTMTSGSNIIPALTNPGVSVAGTGQFGINLRANTSPAVGQDPAGNGTATPTLPYGQVNMFTYNSGDIIASSPLSTDFNIFTVAYLVNVPATQPPGVYSTTLTFVAIASF